MENLMDKDIINLGNPEGLPLSDAVRVGNLVFVSGVVGMTDDGQIVPGGIAAETRQIFRNIETVLRNAGCVLQDVVKVSVVITDRSDFDTFNMIYRQIFSQNPPARTCTVAGLTINARVEIDLVAARAS
jgi:2-iminobutanoate/2-iminopropanoate deaminase